MSEFKPNNCRLDLEDMKFIQDLPELPVKSDVWRDFKRPDEVLVDWHRTENQGRIGSCQGHSLTSVLERLWFVATGKKVQLSEIFAYLATQKIDGLLGSDDGSTITGGAKLGMTVGVPTEDKTGYPQAYPSRSQISAILSQANYAAGAEYKAKSIWRATVSADDSKDFIGGGGGISFGCAWYSGMIPRDRIVRRYSPGNSRSGHAMACLGYRKNGLLICVNSHADGPYEVDPEAWEAILRHPRTAAVGLKGDVEAKPVDWYKESPYFS